MSAAEDFVPALSPLYRFQWEEAQQTHVLLYPEGMVKLSVSAAEILQLCDGERTVAGIIAALQEKFPGAELDDDVRKFIETAQENGWIRNP